jgi:hypothetical protein
MSKGGFWEDLRVAEKRYRDDKAAIAKGTPPAPDQTASKKDFFHSKEHNELVKNNPRIDDALSFIITHDLIPHDVPDDWILKAPIVREKKGPASQGLQAFGQKLNAASAGLPK